MRAKKKSGKSLNPGAPTQSRVEGSAYGRAAREKGLDPSNMPSETSVQAAVKRSKQHMAPRPMPSVQPSQIKRK